MAQYGGQWLAAIRRRLIRFHLQGTRKAAAMTQDEIAVLVQDSLAPDVSASASMPDRVQRDGYRSALPGWPRGELAAESVNGLRAKVDAGEIRPPRHHSAGRIVYLKDNLDAYLDRLFGAVDVASPSEVDLVAECDGSLAPVNLRYLKIYRNQRGKLVAYYRRGGISRRLLTEDGSPVEPGDLASLTAAWQQAHVAFEAAEAAATGAAENRTIKPRTLADLARHYRASDERAEKARATKADYEKGLGPLERNHGLLPVAGLRRHHVAQIRSRYAWREKVDKDGNTERVWNGRQANRIITVLSILLKLAVELLGWRSDNPALRPKRLKTGGVGYLPWKPEEFAQFRKRSDPDWQFAVLVALLTAQRGQDQVAMRWSDYDGSGIYVVQQKGNGRVRLWVPCHPALKESSTLGAHTARPSWARRRSLR